MRIGKTNGVLFCFGSGLDMSSWNYELVFMHIMSFTCAWERTGAGPRLRYCSELSPRHFFANLRPGSVSSWLRHRTFGIGGKTDLKYLQNGIGVSQSELFLKLTLSTSKMASVSANQSCSFNCKWGPNVGMAILLKVSANQSSLFNCKWLPAMAASIVSQLQVQRLTVNGQTRFLITKFGMVLAMDLFVMEIVLKLSQQIFYIRS